MFRLMFAIILLNLAVVRAYAGEAAVGASLADLPSVAVRSAGAASFYSGSGVVEAVRQTVISAQVQGAIIELRVKAGDSVKAGQVLARIDARAAEQTAAASSAQVEAARAELNIATREFARQKQLFERRFISQAALDRAEGQFAATQAQTKSLLAQAGAALTQTNFYTLTAPYAGLVADLPVTQGDMVMPGRSLMTIYDPARLRVTASIPQAVATNLMRSQPVRIEFPGLRADQRWLTVSRVVVLPIADASTHTVKVQLDLAPSTSGLTPGMYANTMFAVAGSDGVHFYVPRASVMRRAELSAVYVINNTGAPVLRQIKLGPVLGNEVEVLSGLTAGERVAVDPLAATRGR